MGNNDIPCCVVSLPLVSLCATACNLNKAPCRWRDSRTPDPCPLSILREMKQLETFTLTELLLMYSNYTLPDLLTRTSSAFLFRSSPMATRPRQTTSVIDTRRHHGQRLMLLYMKRSAVGISFFEQHFFYPGLFISFVEIWQRGCSATI
jgi:hypothetical protein